MKKQLKTTFANQFDVMKIPDHDIVNVDEACGYKYSLINN